MRAIVRRFCIHKRTQVQPGGSYTAARDRAETRPTGDQASTPEDDGLPTGTDDHYVQPRNALSLAKRMRTQHEPVEVHMYPNIGHIRLLLSFSRPLRHSAPALRDTLDFIHAHSTIR